MPEEPIAFYGNQAGDTALGMSLPGCPPVRRTQPIAIAFEPGVMSREGGHCYENISGTIRKEPGDNQMSIAFTCKDSGGDASALSPTLRSMGHDGSHANGGGQVAVATTMAVRRLTPRECERLQGFPDDYTLIPVGKGLAADGPRYKALGNSMAVPCMAWLGRRIGLVDAIPDDFTPSLPKPGVVPAAGG